MSKFWKKVYKCEHRNLFPNYLYVGKCSTPYCTVEEIHCLDCGVYITKCGCGANNGMSGWPFRRWSKQYSKCKKQRGKVVR